MISLPDRHPAAQEQGGCSGAADSGDHLPGDHGVTHVHQGAAVAQVRVAGGDAAAVIDLDPVAVCAERTGLDDHAVGGRVDGRAAG